MAYLLKSLCLALGTCLLVSGMFSQACAETKTHMVAKHTGFRGGSYSAYKKARLVYNDAVRAHQRGDLVTAIAGYKAAIAIYPRDPDYYSNLSMAYMRTGDLSSGEQAARQALNCDSRSSNAWNNLGLALYKQKRFREAEAAYTKACKFGPYSFSHWLNLGNSISEQGRDREAMIAYQKALQLNPPADARRALREEVASITKKLGGGQVSLEQKNTSKSAIDSRLVGTWRTSFKANSSNWTVLWSVSPDGSYSSKVTGSNGQRTAESGKLHANDGRWSIKATSGRADKGSYNLTNDRTLVLTGIKGPVTYARQ